MFFHLKQDEKKKKVAYLKFKGIFYSKNLNIYKKQNQLKPKYNKNSNYF